MKLNTRHVLLSVLAFGLAVPLNTYATNGYFLIGFGAKSRAMGGTGVALNMGGMAAAFNPATLIDSSTSINLGAEFFRPQMHIKHENTTLLGPTDEVSNHDKFIIPSMGAVYKWNDKITVGAAMIGAGMKTEFNQTENNSACLTVRQAGGSCPPTVFNILNTFASTEAGVELYQIQMLPSIAYKLNKTHTVGATIVMAGQYFRAEGLEDFGSAGFTSGGAASTESEARLGLTGVGFSHSFGLGYRLGWLGKFKEDKLNVGFNYSARVHMNPFSRYTKLFAEQGDFDIPENYTLGIAYKVKPEMVVAFDIQQINYSDVASVGNPGPDASNPSEFFSLCPGTNKEPCKLGGPKGLGFGWTDMTIYKLGGEWQYSPKIALRAGYNYGRAPIPNDQVLFNLLAPATVERHLTLGGEYKFQEDIILHVNYMHAFRKTIKGPTAFGVGAVTGTNASISMYQDTMGASLEIQW